MLVQVVDLSEDNFFSLISDDFVTRDDLRLTDNCSPSTAEAVRELLKTAEANGERLVVCISSVMHLLLNHRLANFYHPQMWCSAFGQWACVSVCLSVCL